VVLGTDGVELARLAGIQVFLEEEGKAYRSPDFEIADPGALPDAPQ
jgi:hypothetical protein